MGKTNECGKIEAEVVIEDPDSLPQRQYRYSVEVGSSIWETIKALLDQGIIVEQQSLNNSLI